MRTITVTSTGSAARQPDTITIEFTLSARRPGYSAAARAAEQQLAAITAAITPLAFSATDLKTVAFNVEQDFTPEPGQAPSGVPRPTGFVCRQLLALSFDLDSERLASVLTAITASEAQPEIHVNFTLKDIDALDDAALTDATRRARNKAEILARASGTQLGALQQISYGTDPVHAITRMEFAATTATSQPRFDFTPDDVQVRTPVTFVWEINER